MNSHGIKLAFLLLISLAVVFMSCDKDSEQPTKPKSRPEYSSGEGDVSSDGGIVKDENPDSPTYGASIDIPEGALSEQETISIQAAPDTLQFPGDVQSIIVDMQPSGLTFQEPVTIGLPFNPENQELDHLSIFYYNPDSSEVQEIPVDSIDYARNIAFARISHFSFYTATDGAIRVDVNMFRNSEGKICSKVRIYGVYQGADAGLNAIPTNLATMLNGYLSAGQVVDHYPNPTNFGVVQSIFLVTLRKRNVLWDEDIESLRLRVAKAGDTNVLIFENEDVGGDWLYLAEHLFDDNERELWYEGDNLVFTFDTNPNPDYEYYMEVKWALGQEPEGLGLLRFTNIYTLDNYEARQRVGEMEEHDYDVDPQDHVDDSQQEQQPENQPPVAPSNPSPSNNAQNMSTNTNLSWSCSDPDSDPLRYDVYFGTDTSPDDGELVSTNHQGTSYDPGELDFSTTYYWKIVAKDDHQHSTSGSVWSFTTAGPGNQPPVAPSNPSPSNNAQNMSTDTNLSWSCSDPDSDPLLYDVYFGTDASPDDGELVSTNHQGSSYDPGELDFSTTYYWKIVAKDDHQHSTSGSVWSFATSEEEIIAPELVDYELVPMHPEVHPGESFTARYRINNPNNNTIEILLDARWRSQGGAYGELEPTTHQVMLSTGTAWYERTCTIPVGMDPGSYSFAWYLLWTDNSQITTSGYQDDQFEVLEQGGGDIIEQDFELGNTGEYITMIWVEPGTFIMGAYDGEQDAENNEYPQHPVTISEGFWLGKYEVTQAQWEAVVGENPAHDYGVGDDHPVYYVSWHDIHDDLLTAINATEAGEPWRLPSESEWEYACRAGTETRFYWGDDPDYTEINDYAVYSGNDNGGTAEVGTKLPNAWGLYDMSGNLYEWCEDDYHGSYNGAPDNQTPWINNPRGAYRVLRGGGWNYGAWYCRSAFRHSYAPSFRNFFIGLRLVRSGQ
ncbi:SUMF1/EgtB/PvdO family nonheme iron enzyme [bacterium]|nr:SUMF1/EgtB/PvdO family nonheme iron enzyme [bacterium]